MAQTSGMTPDGDVSSSSDAYTGSVLYNTSQNLSGADGAPPSEGVVDVLGLNDSALRIVPVTGFNVYRHESGVHVDGMLKDARSYEYLPSAWSGRETEYVLGKHSGTALVRHMMQQAGLARQPQMEEWLRQAGA